MDNKDKSMWANGEEVASTVKSLLLSRSDVVQLSESLECFYFLASISRESAVIALGIL